MRVESFGVVTIIVAAVAALAGCPGPGLLGAAGAEASGGASAGTASGPGTGPGSTGSGSADCLPDAANKVLSQCTSCHAAQPVGGAPMPLVTWADLAAMSPKGGSYAERSIVRMEDQQSPMPPAGSPAVAPADIAAFAAWTSAGMPKAMCSSTGTGMSSSGAQTSSSGGSSSSGGGLCLPMAATDVTVSYCAGCHSNPPVSGAPMPLLTAADLAAASPKGGSYADRSVVRMNNAQSPMPPSGSQAVPPAMVAAFAAWVSGGMQLDQCMGSSSSSSSSGGNNPYNTPDTCTSNITWAGGSEDWNGYSKTAMHPGRACINCHENPQQGQDHGPSMYFAGTVYPTAHEYDECFGEQNADVVVQITDANQQMIEKPLGASGNFYERTSGPAVAFPISARVVNKKSGAFRAMSQTVTTGDCNSCHTLHGSGNPAAPGRIMAP